MSTRIGFGCPGCSVHCWDLTQNLRPGAQEKGLRRLLPRGSVPRWTETEQSGVGTGDWGLELLCDVLCFPLLGDRGARAEGTDWG